jgi:hypothetical protein
MLRSGLKLSTYILHQQEHGRLFSPEYLATFNGENPDKPIYIAVRIDPVFCTGFTLHSFR